MDTQKLLTDIEIKVKKLNVRLQRLEMENKDLRSSVFNYLQQLDHQKKEMNQLEMNIKNQQVADHMLKDKKALQKELDKYILLVDKCMAAIKVTSIVEA